MNISRRGHGRRHAGTLAAILVIAACLLAAVPTLSFANVGVQDGTFSPSAPTGQKPQSKLWFTSDNTWWADMYSSSAGKWDIFRLDRATNKWVDTGVGIDAGYTAADTLLDGNTLYVASAGDAISSGPSDQPVGGGLTRPGKIFKYTYNATSKTWTADGIISSDVTNGLGVEALTIAKDSTGELWVTFTKNAKLYVAHGSDAVGQGAWTPYQVGTQDLEMDDISAIVAFGGKIGVLYSDQNPGSTPGVDDGGMYFAVHNDGAGDAPGDWSTSRIPGTPDSTWADDHMNVKTDGSTVYAVAKTSLHSGAQPIEQLLVRKSDGSWSAKTIWTVADDTSRAQVVLGPGTIYALSVSPCCNGGTVYLKSASISNPSFGPGLGTPFMQSNVNAKLNNPSSTKQTISDATGLVAIAADDQSKRYMHTAMDLGTQVTGAPDTTIDSSPPAQTVANTASFAFSSTEPFSTFQCQLDGGAWGVCPSTYTGIAVGQHTFAVRAVDALGAADLTPATYTWTVASAAPKHYPTVADAYVDAAATQVDKNFGDRNILYADSEAAGAGKRSYLRFTVANFLGPVQSAVLRVFVTSGADKGLDLWQVSNNTWSETGITWNNKPALGQGLGTIAPTAGGSWAEFDVSKVVKGNGTYSFALTTTSTIAEQLASKEAGAGTAPELVVTPDSQAPTTTIDSGPSGTVSEGKATFAFHSSEAGSTYQCQLDAGAVTPCTSPQDYQGLTEGQHTFKVSAIDAAGNADLVGATRTWSVAFAPVSQPTQPTTQPGGGTNPNQGGNQQGSGIVPKSFGRDDKITMRISRKGLKLSRKNLVAIRMTNANPFVVQARYLLDVVQSSKSRKGHASKRIRVASKLIALPASKSVTVHFRVSKQARRLLRHGRSIRVRLTVALYAPEGNRRVVRTTVRLHA